MTRRCRPMTADEAAALRRRLGWDVEPEGERCMTDRIAFPVGTPAGVSRGRAGRCPECGADNWLGFDRGMWMCAGCCAEEPAPPAEASAAMAAALRRGMEAMCLAVLAPEIRRMSSSREPLGTDGAEGADEFGEAD